MLSKLTRPFPLPLTRGLSTPPVELRELLPPVVDKGLSFPPMGFKGLRLEPSLFNGVSPVIVVYETISKY